MSCNVAFANLRAEMSRSNITIGDISKTLGLNRDTASRKLSRKTAISLNEAFFIKNKYFPKMEIQYLFEELISTGQPDRAS